MKAFGVILALLGAAVAMAAFGVDGAAPGERVLNIGLLNQKAMLATIGGALLIGGTVLVGAAGILGAVSEHKNAVLAEIRGEREDLRIGFKSLWDELDQVRANTAAAAPIPVYGTTPVNPGEGQLREPQTAASEIWTRPQQKQ